MLLRLRQAYDSKSSWKSAIEKAKKLSYDKRVFLLNCLEASSAICGICSDAPEDAVVSECGHVFCSQCIGDSLAGDDNQFPNTRCKARLTLSSVFSKATLKRSLSVQLDDSKGMGFEVFEDRSHNSSKIKAIIEVLCSVCKPKIFTTENREKAIVFSQWTRMLDLLELSLEASGLEYRRLDVTMPVIARDKAVKDFNTRPEIDGQKTGHQRK